MPPVKCAPSNSCVPPPMGAVGVTLKDRALDYFYITLGIFNSLGPIYSFTMINQTTSGLERQIGPFSGPYLDIGPDRDQVPKSGLHRKHCKSFTKCFFADKTSFFGLSEKILLQLVQCAL